MFREYDVQSLHYHLSKVMREREEIEGEEMLEPFRRVRFNLGMLGRSTASATFFLDEPTPEKVVAFTFFASGRRQEADDLIVDALQGQLREFVDLLAEGGGEFRFATNIVDTKYRPLCGTVIMPSPLNINAPPDQTAIVREAQVVFAAAFFRWKGIA